MCVCVLVHPVSQACVGAHTHESRHVLKKKKKGGVGRKEPPLYLRVCIAVYVYARDTTGCSNTAFSS